MKKFISKGIYKDHKILENYGFTIENGTFKDILPNSEISNSAYLTALDGFVYPAFIESHAHIGELTNMLQYINGEMFNDRTLLKTVEEAQNEPIFIFNVDFNKISTDVFKNLFKIDKDIFIQSKDEHSTFVSKKLIDKNRIDINGLNRESITFKDGEFIGIFKDNAIKRVSGLKNYVLDKNILNKVEDYFLSRGIVSVTNFDYYTEEFLRTNDLRIRVVQGIAVDYLNAAIKAHIKTGDSVSESFTWGPVKVFLDGSLGSQTCAMKDEKPFKGVLLLDEEAFTEIVKKANEAGLNVAVHAIGSKAVNIALKSFKTCERLSKLNRIEHLQFIDEGDLPLLEETPFIPSMQPIHATSDKVLYQTYMENFRYAYAWNTVYKEKGVIIFGSDAPVEDASPLKGIYSATHRDYLTEECIPLDLVISAYTEFGGEYNYSRKQGKIEKEYLGDFTVLKNPLKEDNLLDNNVILTAKGGEIVWTK